MCVGLWCTGGLSSGQFGRFSCGSVRPLAAQELHANSNTGAEANASALAVYSPGYTYGLTCIAGGTAKANEARGQVRAMLHPHLALISPRAATASTALRLRRLLQPCYSPAAAAAAACAPSLGAPRMRPVVRVRIKVRVRARARARARARVRARVRVSRRADLLGERAQRRLGRLACRLEGASAVGGLVGLGLG